MEPVKVVTGIRRCGKSSLLKLMVQHLKDSGIAEDQIIEMNFEFHDFKKMNADDFYQYVKERVLPRKQMYLFFDELQRIDHWEDTVNSFREFIDFHGFEVKEVSSALGGTRTVAFHESGDHYELREIFDAYMRFGGMPGITDVGLDQERAMVLLDGIYSTVVVRDILEREKRRGQKQITDPVLLRKIILSRHISPH